MIRIATNGHAYDAVTPSVEAAWRELLTTIGREVDVAFDFLPYPVLQPQKELWSRNDLGCVFVTCGYPIAMDHAPVTPIAAHIPLVVNADVILDHPVEAKVDHLSEDGGFSGPPDADSGASRGDTGFEASGDGYSSDCEGARAVAQNGAALFAGSERETLRTS